MKKYVSILFLAIYMLSTHAEILELGKFPLLIEHFKEHQQWDTNVSFLGFMYMHYFEDDNKYGDQARDLQMPFKTTFHSSAVQDGFIPPLTDFAIVLKTLFKERKLKPFANSSAYSSQYLSSIWQPPKSC